MAELLTDSEIFELTGIEQPAAQSRVLKEHGLQLIVRRDGRPRITLSALNAAMSAQGTKALEPDFSAMKSGK